MILQPGEWALTEWRGRFFAVGTMNVAYSEQEHGFEQTRCCAKGHDDPTDVEDCWENGPVELEPVYAAIEGWQYCGLSPDGRGGLGRFWRTDEEHRCGSCRPVFQRVDSDGAPIHDLMLDQPRTLRPE